jgi:hypothetical protein
MMSLTNQQITYFGDQAGRSRSRHEKILDKSIGISLIQIVFNVEAQIRHSDSDDSACGQDTSHLRQKTPRLTAVKVFQHMTGVDDLDRPIAVWYRFYRIGVSDIFPPDHHHKLLLFTGEQARSLK